MKAKTLLLTGIAALLLASCSPANRSKQQASVAVYVSQTGEVVTASYDIQAGTVQVILPNKSSVKFYQATSASGARYTNENVTFWEHQGEATYSVRDRIIFVGKVK